MRHFHGAFTGTRFPRLTKTVRVAITGADGVVLRAFDVALVEDTELAAAISIGEMVSDFAGEENVTDVTVATALRASLIDESNANNSPFTEEDPSEFEDGTSASWETL